MHLTSKNNLSQVTRLGLSQAIARFKLRNEGSYLGVFWYLLNPMLLLFIIILVAQQFQIKTDHNYVIYVFVGLIMFNLFRQSTLSNSSVVTNNSRIIKSFKFPLIALVIGEILMYLFTHLFEIAVLIAIMLITGVNPATLLLYLPILSMFTVFTFGVSLIISTISVNVRDMQQVWQFITYLWWLATPIFYFLTPETWLYKINVFNPIYLFINLTRNIIFTKSINWFEFNTGLVWTIVVVSIGLIVFNKFSGKFAEKV